MTQTNKYLEKIAKIENDRLEEENPYVGAAGGAALSAGLGYGLGKLLQRTNAPAMNFVGQALSSKPGIGVLGGSGAIQGYVENDEYNKKRHKLNQILDEYDESLQKESAEKLPKEPLNKKERYNESSPHSGALAGTAIGGLTGAGAGAGAVGAGRLLNDKIRSRVPDAEIVDNKLPRPGMSQKEKIKKHKPQKLKGARELNYRRGKMGLAAALSGLAGSYAGMIGGSSYGSGKWGGTEKALEDYEQIRKKKMKEEKKMEKSSEQVLLSELEKVAKKKTMTSFSKFKKDTSAEMPKKPNVNTKKSLTPDDTREG